MLRIIKLEGCQRDTLAEWLRRRPAKPVGSARVGSNPTGVVFIGEKEETVLLAMVPY